jgi:hypothetical protein
VVQPPPFSFMKRKINKTRGKTNTSSNLWISSRNTTTYPDPRKSFKEDGEGSVQPPTIHLRDEEDKQNKGKNNHNTKSANIIKNHGGGSVDSNPRKLFSKTREK